MEASQSEGPVEVATSEPPQATDGANRAVGQRRGRQRDRTATSVAELELKAKRLPPQIQVDIDPAITSGFIHDRHDLLIRGRVVSSVPIGEASLLLDGTAVGRVQYRPGEPRRTDRSARWHRRDAVRCSISIFRCRAIRDTASAPVSLLFACRMATHMRNASTCWSIPPVRCRSRSPPVPRARP